MAIRRSSSEVPVLSKRGAYLEARIFSTKGKTSSFQRLRNAPIAEATWSNNSSSTSFSSSKAARSSSSKSSAAWRERRSFRRSSAFLRTVSKALKASSIHFCSTITLASGIISTISATPSSSVAVISSSGSRPKASINGGQIKLRIAETSAAVTPGMFFSKPITAERSREGSSCAAERRMSSWRKKRSKGVTFGSVGETQRDKTCWT
mmetsp:Transcript_32373/g.58801  ORF Transcript_32373/g.58801 Transcript_32373/m.58801 type:complete len:207 (-) Transcript_32373:2269-2889(-)